MAGYCCTLEKNIMNSAGITRCPQCEISFRVTDEQLRMADGAVRCGSCLTIFQAESFMEDVPPHLEEADDSILDEVIENQTAGRRYAPQPQTVFSRFVKKTKKAFTDRTTESN